MGWYLVIVLLGFGLSAIEAGSYQYSTTAVQREYAAKVAKKIVEEEVAKALNLAKKSEAQLKAAREALVSARHDAQNAHQLMNGRSASVEKLRAEVKRLTSEKHAAEYAKSEAIRAAERADRLEAEAGARIQKAREQAENADKIVASREGDFHNAQMAVNAAQKSIDFIPAGSPQTRVTFFKSQMNRLRQEASYAKELWAKAKADARMYHAKLQQAQHYATQVWIDSSKVFQDRRVTVEIFEAKCEALANTQAAYVKATSDLQTAKNKWLPKKQAVSDAEDYVATKLEKVGDYWAVYYAILDISTCPRGAKAPRAPVTARGGSSEERTNVPAGRRRFPSVRGGGSSQRAAEKSSRNSQAGRAYPSYRSASARRQSQRSMFRQASSGSSSSEGD